MKAVLTIILTLFFGALALAQNESTDAKVETSKMDIVLDAGAIDTGNIEQVKTTDKVDLARVYKFKNSRVKNALAFNTKNNRPKLA